MFRVLSVIGLVVPIILAACTPNSKTNAPAKQVASVSESGGHTPLPVMGGDHPGEYLFHGYRCDSDCRLHQEGYQWAAEHKIANPKDCRGTSEEVIEGCLAFAGIEGPLGERDFDVSFPHMSGIN